MAEAQAAAAAAAAAGAAAAAKAKSVGALAGAGAGCGGAEVAGRAEIARRWGRGGPCRPCLGDGPGRAVRGQPGAASRLSSFFAVGAAAAGLGSGRAGPVSARRPHLLPPSGPAPLPPRRESPKRAGEQWADRKSVV